MRRPVLRAPARATVPGGVPVSGNLAPAIGLAVLALLMVLAVVLPLLLGWDVAARRDGVRSAAPLHGQWRLHYDERIFGIGTVPAVLLALGGWYWGPRLAARLTFPRLLAVAFFAGVAWLLALALVDGRPGISRVLGNPYEYLETARNLTDPGDFGDFLHRWIERMPAKSGPDQLRTHISGHPPGALLFFILLVRIGLGGNFVAGIVVTVIAATIPLAVLSTLRSLGAEQVGRRITPFLVLTPTALFLAVSADAVFSAIAAWGIAALAGAATARAPGRRIGLSVLAGLLLGYGVMMSYGLPLIGLVAIAVLVLARSWTPLPIAAVVALAIVLAFAVAGFAIWEAWPVLRGRYYGGVASVRPYAYWVWANLALIGFSAGPLIGAGAGSLVALRGRADRTVLLLAGAAIAMIAIADLSGMSKAEVERIWLPFFPWLTIALSALPERWARVGLGVQLAFAVLLQHLVYTSW